MAFSICSGYNPTMQLSAMYQNPFPYNPNSDLATTVVGNINDPITAGATLYVTATTTGLLAGITALSN
ncbi:hypothetical protein HDU83_006680, partial [Entophlyctis luteolus]